MAGQGDGERKLMEWTKCAEWLVDKNENENVLFQVGVWIMGGDWMSGVHVLSKK